MPKPYDREEDRWNEFDEAIRRQWENQRDRIDFDFPELPRRNFLNKAQKENINIFHDLIFKNPSFTVSELEELEWMGEALDLNHIGPMEGS